MAKQVLPEPLGYHPNGRWGECLPEHLSCVGTYAAPGCGTAWQCRVCGREWVQIGDRMFDPAEGAHILTLEDVR